MKNDKNNIKDPAAANRESYVQQESLDAVKSRPENLNSTVIVTGASRGIGRAAALTLADGCRGTAPRLLNAENVLPENAENQPVRAIAICADRDREGLEETAGLIRQKNPDCRVFSYLGDVADEAFVNHMVSDFEKKTGRPVYVLVNNAGISIVGLVQDLSLSDWHRIMDVNLTSVFLLSRAVIPGMVHAKAGHIINISSMWGRAGASCEAAYSATKGGVIAFTQALAKELAPSGISVNAIAPGCVDTAMNGHLSAGEKAALAEEIPAGRFASPEEIAAIIAAVAQAPAYMTGQVVGVDGGYI